MRHLGATFCLAFSSIFIFACESGSDKPPVNPPEKQADATLFVTSADKSRLFDSVGLFFNTIVTRPREAMIGLTLILTGIPVYFFFRKKQSRNDAD